MPSNHFDQRAYLSIIYSLSKKIAYVVSSVTNVSHTSESLSVAAQSLVPGRLLIWSRRVVVMCTSR